jgi:hypothetical protein
MDRRVPATYRFIEMARDLGCDEDEAAYREKLVRIARHKLEPQSEWPPREKRTTS